MTSRHDRGDKVASTKKDAIVIGGGHNGLIAAAYLARAGLDVLVLERREIAGGAATTEQLIPGFDTSPCAYHLHLLQSQVASDLRLFENGLQVVSLDPVYLNPYLDGRSLIQWRDVARTQEQIAPFSAADAEAYPRWLAFWREVGELFDPYTLSSTPPTLEQLTASVTGTPAEELLDTLVNWPIRKLMDHFFESETVQAALMPNSDTRSLDEPGELLGWAATAPNRGALARHQGLPIGSMRSFGTAVHRAAVDCGVDVRLGVDVAEILLDDAGAACGVRLHDGSTIEASVVLSNADPKRTFGQLLPTDARHAETVRSVTDLDTESGSLKFHAAVSELPDFSAHLGPDFDPTLLGMIRICPSTSYVDSSLADAAAGRPTDSPILIVMIPTVGDQSVAPPGQHLVSMRVKFEPSRLRSGTWAEHRNAVADQVIDLFTAHAPNFRDSILDWVMYTPDDIEAHSGLTDANIHHINHSAGQVLGDRLFPGGGYRTPIANLYMCGAGAHPGGEVTGAPGYNAADRVLRDLASDQGRRA
jgi:phytoene dehydrogenase-like protein